MADDPGPAPPANHSVQLGIGTLIIIAIIVSMCSGKGEMEQVRNDTTALKQQLAEVNGKLDQLLAKPLPAPDADVEKPADAGANAPSSP